MEDNKSKLTLEEKKTRLKNYIPEIIKIANTYGISITEAFYKFAYLVNLRSKLRAENKTKKEIQVVFSQRKNEYKQQDNYQLIKWIKTFDEVTDYCGTSIAEYEFSES
ncbi:MAG: hypothetical protein HC831_04955 [Chloroflexia bacterium]|nr:hypothetical protein [Chloroflexia bacterium]